MCQLINNQFVKKEMSVEEDHQSEAHGNMSDFRSMHLSSSRLTDEAWWVELGGTQKVVAK